MNPGCGNEPFKDTKCNEGKRGDGKKGLPGRGEPTGLDRENVKTPHTPGRIKEDCKGDEKGSILTSENRSRVLRKTGEKKKKGQHKSGGV